MSAAKARAEGFAAALDDASPPTPVTHGAPTSERVELWDAINEYASACGGDTTERTVSSRRMDAVARIERAVRTLASHAEAEATSREDKEAARWQERIAETIRQAGLDPADASGTESGDPLDWTDYQVCAALVAMQDRIDALTPSPVTHGAPSALEQATEALRATLETGGHLYSFIADPGHMDANNRAGSRLDRFAEAAASARAALARIEAEPVAVCGLCGGPVDASAAAEDRGHKAGWQAAADHLASINGEWAQMAAEEIGWSPSVGAAARPKEKP